MSDAFGVVGAGADLCSQLRARAQTLLLAANTLALAQVETSRDDAFTGDDPFAIAIYTPKISRTWLGDSPLQFTAKINLAIVARVLAPSLKQVETDADTMRVQIEQGLLSSPAFYAAPMERINSIDTTIEFPGNNEQHEAQVTVLLECQCTDVFAPNLTAAPALATVNATVPNATVPPGTLPADNLIGATIIIP